MTDNDYIAEYIKEKHPGFLSFDFAVWKFAKQIVEAANILSEQLTNIFSDIPLEEKSDFEESEEQA